MYKVKGVITAISEPKTLDNGATVLDYTVSVKDNDWSTLYSIDMYKKPEHNEHLENFLKFNKVGDDVEIEFTIRAREYEGRVFNSLSHWRCDTLKTEAVATETDDLPF